MWLEDQPHRGDWRNLRFRLGGPTNLHAAHPEFAIDAKREELSNLTVLPNPIASGLGGIAPASGSAAPRRAICSRRSTACTRFPNYRPATPYDTRSEDEAMRWLRND